jgi:transposase
LAVHPSQPKLVMAQPEKEKAMTTDIVQQIRKTTRRRFTAEEKIRIVLEGLRGEIPITDLCRKEGI